MGRRGPASSPCGPAGSQAGGRRGFGIADGPPFIIVEQDEIGQAPLSGGSTLLAAYRYHGFDGASPRSARSTRWPARPLLPDLLLRRRPHRRPRPRRAGEPHHGPPTQSKANAGSFTNGMPMTSSLGCGIWGGNVTNENISLKHFLNVTWVSRPIPEDRPSEQELFGDFYGTPPLDASTRGA